MGCSSMPGPSLTGFGSTVPDGLRPETDGGQKHDALRHVVLRAAYQGRHGVARQVFVGIRPQERGEQLRLTLSSGRRNRLRAPCHQSLRYCARPRRHRYPAGVEARRHQPPFLASSTHAAMPRTRRSTGGLATIEPFTTTTGGLLRRRLWRRGPPATSAAIPANRRTGPKPYPKSRRTGVAPLALSGPRQSLPRLNEYAA